MMRQTSTAATLIVQLQISQHAALKRAIVHQSTVQPEGLPILEPDIFVAKASCAQKQIGQLVAWISHDVRAQYIVQMEIIMSSMQTHPPSFVKAKNARHRITNFAVRLRANAPHSNARKERFSRMAMRTCTVPMNLVLVKSGRHVA